MDSDHDDTDDAGATGPRGKTGASSPYARRNALILYAFTAAVFLILIIRGELRDNNIADLQADQGALTHQVSDLQTKTSDEVLCPLYSTLVDQIRHLTPKQRAKPRIHKQVVVIRKGFKALDCKPADTTTAP